MKTRIFNPYIALIFILIFNIPSFAGIILVPADYSTIQSGIDAASNGDTVFVADGIYTGEGNMDIDFKGKAITLRSENGPENCIIDCNQNGQGFYFHSNEDSNSILDGFTIVNGDASYGGGIYCTNSSPVISNCIIKENLGAEGGGIYCAQSIATISNCIIKENLASRGGGIYGGSIELIDCTICSNHSSESGGGIYCWYSETGMRLYNCNIYGNIAYSQGGGICGYTGTLANCLIVGNRTHPTYGQGGGIYSEDRLTFENCTICNNTSASGGGIYNFTNNYLQITNCIIWDNNDLSGSKENAQITNAGSSPIIYSCIQDANSNDDYIPFGGVDKGNIDDNPLFVRTPNGGSDGWGDDYETPDVNEGANDDFGDLHLTEQSPCINTGNLSFFKIGETDIDNQPRVMGLRIDMGVDEFFMPMLIVTKPKAGDIWISGSIHWINWDTHINSNPVDILWSCDAGGSWQNIVSDIANTGSFRWSLPDIVDSNQCLVKVIPHVPDSNVVCEPSGLFTIRPDNPDPIVNNKWKSLGGNFKRTGLSKENGPELGCIAWKFEIDGAISSGVTIGAYDTVHISCENGKLYKLQPYGIQSLLWSYDTNSPLLSSPTLGPDGTVYVGAKNGKLYAISSSGSLRWTHSTDSFIYSSPAVSADGCIYVGSTDGKLTALGQDGSELWQFETGSTAKYEGAIFASPAIGADGTIYIAGLYEPNLYALEPDTGDVKWVCHFNSGGWPFASPVIAENGTIYQTLISDTNLYAIEPNTGAIAWSTNLADTSSGLFEPDYATKYAYSFCFSEPVLGPDGTIYVSFDDPYLRAVDIDGHIKWVKRLGVVGGFTMTIGNDGLIYAAGDDGYLCVVSPAGEELARFDCLGWLNYPVITSDNTIIVTDTKDDSLMTDDPNNIVYAITMENCAGRENILHRLYDLNKDRITDIYDFALLADDWLLFTEQPVNYPYPARYRADVLYLTGDINRNMYVNYSDFLLLVEQWLSED